MTPQTTITDPFKARLAALDAVFGRHSSVYREHQSFREGGPVAFAEFPQYLPKTVIYCTCELTGPDEADAPSGQRPCPSPGRSGEFEIVIALPITSKILPRRYQAGLMDHGGVGHVLRDLARLCTQEDFASGAVVPLTEPSITPVTAALLVDISSSKHPFTHAGAEHGLLLAMFIHAGELAYCRSHGHKALIALLREAGAYPTSDHRRASVV
jgi:hypothetical protein